MFITEQNSALQTGPIACACALLCLSLTAIAQTPTTTLKEVQVREQAGGNDTTQTYENPAVTGATGLALTRRETPQSISVLTRQQLDDENAQTLDDALLYATGITATQLDVGGRVDYRARGFVINTFRVDGATVNGGKDFSSQSMSINMDLYDRVEILRGANGLLGTTGDPSGVVNLVRKTPSKQASRSVGLTLGSWDKKHLTADLSQPLNSDGSLRARLVVSADDSGGFRDREKDKSLGALLHVVADLSADTQLGVGLQYERRHIDGATWGTNVPLWFADGSATNFRRSMSAAADWSYSERDTQTVFANLDHKLNRDWSTSLRAAYTTGDASSHLAVSKPNRDGNGGYWHQDGSNAYLNTMFNENENRATNLQWTLNGRYQLWGRSHQFMAGANLTDSKITTFGLDCFNSAGAKVACINRINSQFKIPDWRDFIAHGASIGEVTAQRTGNNTSVRTKNYGAYLANRFSVNDQLSLIAGARLSWYRSYTTGGKLTSEFNHKLTPYLGAVYDLNRNYSLYASYTDVFEAQALRKVNGDYVDPKTGKAYEVGVKGEWLDGQVDGSASIFYSKQSDVAVLARDASGNTVQVDGSTENAYVNGSAGVRTKGLELDFSGRLTPNWNVYGGYTLLSVDNPNKPNSDDDPRHLLRLNTSYRLPGALSKLTVGMGMTTQSQMRQAPAGNSHPTQGANVNINLKGYTLFHAMARYEISKDVTATLNISNLLDKTYYRQYGFYAGSIYGEPRRISVGLNARF